MMLFSVIIFVTGLQVQEYTLLSKDRSNVWQMNPGVTVCGNSGVSMTRASKAIKYWEMLGYKFDYIRMDHQINCHTPRYGEIIITLPEQDFNFNEHLASTRTTISNKTKEIVKAKIQIYPKSAQKERVLEHEIGHALGWPHINQPYHIMNSNWHSGGHNSSGLRLKLFYKKYID